MQAVFSRVLRPSGVMLVVAGTVVGIFFVWMIFITPERLHALLSAYPGFDRLDERYLLFDRLTKLRDSRNMTATRIVLIGASTTRESIWSEKDLAAKIERQTGRDVSVVDLTSSDQSLHLSWALVDDFICGNGGKLAIMGANLARFARPLSKHDPALSMGYRSQSTDANLGLDGWRFGSNRYFLTNAGFVAQSLVLLPDIFVRDLFKTSRKRRDDRHGGHRYLGSKRTKVEMHMNKKLDKAATRYAEKFPASRASAMEVLAKIVRTAQACGGEVILIDTPVNPWLMKSPSLRRYRETYEEHVRALSGFAAEQGLTMINPNEEITYQISDFYDQGHLRQEKAIRATTEVIAEGVAKHILQVGRFGP